MTNVYHIAGLDERERGFNRQAQVTAEGPTYKAWLRYEVLQLQVDNIRSEEEAVAELIQELHRRGYTQLRTQKIFYGERYLGNQEMWVDYPDPEPQDVPSSRWLSKVAWFFGFGKSG